MFLVYPFYWVLGKSMTLLAWVLFNPIVVLFVDQDGNLPKYLYYFQTFDAPIPKGYWAGLKWLNRNPCYGFDLFVFGIPWHKEDWTIRNHIKNEKEDFFFATNKNGAFSFYYYDKSGPHYWKFGWKAWNFLDENGTLNGTWQGTSGKVPVC